MLHLLVIYALASGLAAQLVDQIPADIKADIVKEKPPEQPKTPPPPPPDLVKPPPPFIPPPDIVIANEAPTNAITNVTNVVAPPPKASAVPATLAAGRNNNCASKYYPAIAIRLNHEGNTVVTVHIGADGAVTSADVSQSSGFNDLDQAAVQCVTAQWRFSPATSNGTPIESTKQYRIVWKLTG
ncbi:MAG TPA: energy transducer TonB [Acetobacteraceae bacterium]|nr:energy transducer TonB [Acetobacteraceae bacterium]